MSNLYNLPKDILVKLLATIEQNVRKEYAVDMKILSHFKYKYDKCSYKYCDVYNAHHVTHKNGSVHDGYLTKYVCQKCDTESSWFCNDHINTDTTIRCYCVGSIIALCPSCVKDEIICSGCDKCRSAELKKFINIH